MAAALDTGSALMEATKSAAHCPDWILEILEHLQTASDLAGMTIISFGFAVAAVRWITTEVKLTAKRGDPSQRWTSLRGIRLFLGNYILLGLEFMIVSDIIHSFLKPDMDSLILLGAIVVIRTAISYFLGRELEAVKQEPPA